jgi:hypothetical protein
MYIKKVITTVQRGIRNGPYEGHMGSEESGSENYVLNSMKLRI